MKAPIRSLLLALALTALATSSALAQPIDQPASCAGYLAAWANPNNGFVIQEIVLPTARNLGIAPGALTSEIAHLHLAGLEPCIA